MPPCKRLHGGGITWVDARLHPFTGVAMSYSALLSRIVPCVCAVVLLAALHSANASPNVAKVTGQGTHFSAQLALSSDPQVTNDPNPSIDQQIPDDSDASDDQDS
jgi:hypothetical protein